MDQTRTIYLAGGCFWGVEELFRQIPGVLATQVGYANGTLDKGVTYERVCRGDTGFRETVRVEFDPSALSPDQLLWAYFQIIDPTLENRQGNDIGTQYQTGIYWPAEDAELADAVRRSVAAERQRVEGQGAPFRVEACELERFVPGEEYHQHYLVKNPHGYCHVSPLKMREVLLALAHDA